MRDWRERYAAPRRGARGSDAPLARMHHESRAAGANLRAIGSAWARAAFDGPFFETPPGDGLSAGIVFVRSRDGNTGTRNPAAFGGGAVDEHLVYEGLSRVAAGAVVAGAGTLHPDALFTVWRPALVELRRSLNLPRHPAQVVMSADGSVKPDDLLIFNLPEVPVYVLTSDAGRDRLSVPLAARPWVTAIAGRSSPNSSGGCARRESAARAPSAAADPPPRSWTRIW